MAPFAPSPMPDDEETVTRPLLRPAAFMLPRVPKPPRVPRLPRPAMSTDVSIELEPLTEPKGALPDLSCEEDWATTSPMSRGSRAETTITRPRRPPPSLPVPLVKRIPEPRKSSLPPVPAFTRPKQSSLPPIPAFTRAPSQPPPKRSSSLPPAIRIPSTTEASVAEIEIREDLRVDWPSLDVVPTNPLPAYRPRMETVRGIERPASSAPPPPPSMNSDVGAFALSAPRHEPRAITKKSSFKKLWRAARTDAWTALLMLPIAVSLVSIVVLGVTALASSGGDSANRRVVTVSDANGFALSSATVFVDGAAKCQAVPCALDLPEGTHWVTVAALGYDAPPARAVTTGAEGPKQIDFVLAPRGVAPAPVYQPPAAPLAAALAPPPVREPAPEPAPAPEPEPEPAPVAKSYSAPAPAPARAPAPTLVRSVPAGGARLNINSVPASNVVLDGRPLGRTPQIGISVSPGPHTVVFINGKKRVVRSTNVGAGKTAVVAAKL